MAKVSIFTLCYCVAGIYCSFLSWSFLHEKISTQTFGGRKFQAPLFISLVQSFFAFVLGTVYLYFKEFYPRKNTKENKTSFASYLYTFYCDSGLLKFLFVVSLTQSISSPVGNSSLEHVDFVTYLLAKSCKLIPVLVIHTVVYKRRFPLHKYAIALLITAGIFLFSYSPKGKNSSSADKSGNAALGITYIMISLLLDGLTNSTQDQMFRKFPKMTGIHLMVSLNFISFWLVLIYSTVITNQLWYSIDFISQHPDVFWKNIALYGLCGAVGQIFIFLTLAAFDSMVLITINVTRKMVSMLMSLVLFNHPLNGMKIGGIGLVFFGIGLESYLKFAAKSEKNEKKTEKKDEIKNN